MAENSLFPTLATKAELQRTKQVQVYKTDAVARVLDINDKLIVNAFDDVPMNMMPSAKFNDEFGLVIKYTARDVGIVEKLHEYDGVRLSQIALRYYGGLTISEVKLAFEMALTGGLDDYLPQRNGVADKAHYQRFSVEYFTKIMGAYVARKGKVISKAHNVISSNRSAQELDVKVKQSVAKMRRALCVSYWHYKYHGWADIEYPRSFHDQLFSVGLADDYKVTQFHYAEARQNKPESNILSSLSPEYYVKEYARRDAVIDAFSQMVKDETNIEDYV